MTPPTGPDQSTGLSPTPDPDGAVAGLPSDDDSGEETARRWRLLLGSAADEQLCDGGLGVGLSAEETAMDAALAALYDETGEGRDGSGEGRPRRRSAGLGASAPRVARWLGDIRSYFPTGVVSVLQRDAVERLQLHQLLLEPELLDSVQADVHLVGTLVALNRVMPEHTRATARAVVRKVVDQIELRIADRTRSAISGAVDRAVRTHRPRLRDIDWNRTIAANLAHYLPEHRTVVPERLVGHGRSSAVVAKDIVVAIDQSGSMAESVVYASVFGAVLAGIRTVRTSLVAFDTSVVDLSDLLEDPVDILFGCQLGGGTDINGAIAYCQTLVTRPADTVLVLISDLFEGGIADDLLKRVAMLLADGVTVISLLALSDSGAPAYDREHAAALVALGVPAFACTPELFPELLAVALRGDDVGSWVSASQLAAREA